MTREEAIRRIKAWNLDSDDRDVLAVVIPEFHESEDERIRKVIVKYFKELHEQSWINLEIPDILAWLERQKEEDEEDNDFTIYHPLKNGKGEYECIPYSFYGSLTSFSEDKDLIDFLRTCFYTEEECNEWIEQQKEEEGYEAIPVESTLEYKLGFKAGKESENQKEQKSTEWDKLQADFRSINKAFEDGKKEVIANPEKYGLCRHEGWSEEDEKMVKEALYCVGYTFGNTHPLVAWLKSLRPRLSDEEIKKIRSEEYTNGFNDCLLGKQKGWSKADEEMLDSIIKVVCGVGIQPNGLREKQVRFLKSLRPSWKPSEDLEEAVEELFETIEIQEHENIFEDTFKKIFIAGVEWQKQQKLLEWSDNFEENIRKLLHDKLTWHSEDGSISSTVFIDDKTLKDIINGIWFYVGKEALKYPNKELNVVEWNEEDEKIRKEMLAFFKNFYETGTWNAISDCKEWIAYLEKQKDASKAIEVVDRIDKYIDENVANAHDMKNSNPDKKYYRGWDDALGAMAGILQDVYSNEHPKEQWLTAKINGEPIPTENYSVNIPLAEWSDEDSDNLERVDNYLWMLDDYVGDDCAIPQGKTDKIRGNIQGILSPWLKSLPERFNLQPKQEWSEEDEKPFNDVLSGLKYAYEDLTNHKSFDSAKDIKEAFDWMQARVKNFRPKPKQGWSEEDEKMINTLVSYVEDPSCWNLKCPREKLVAFIKSLPKRFSLQPKQEWGEEDEHRITDAIYFLESAKRHYADTSEIDKTINYLKALRPAWKPNEAQMRAIRNFPTGLFIGDGDYAALLSLIEDLGKLYYKRMQ